MLQNANAGAIVNGVSVIDVSALEQAAESSNESSATAEAQNETHETDPLGDTSPHFITVTGKYAQFKYIIYLKHVFTPRRFQNFYFFFCLPDWL